MRAVTLGILSWRFKKKGLDQPGQSPLFDKAVNTLITDGGISIPAAVEKACVSMTHFQDFHHFHDNAGKRFGKACAEFYEKAFYAKTEEACDAILADIPRDAFRTYLDTYEKKSLFPAYNTNLGF